VGSNPTVSAKSSGVS